MVRYDPRFGRVWRRLIGIILSYAVAFQIFLVGVAGVAVSANAATEDGLSVFDDSASIARKTIKMGLPAR